MRNEKGHIPYRFGADGNLRLYSYDRLFFALYGYDGGTTRTYKYSMDLSPNWVNGRLESVNFNLHNAMFYPNSYINFNNDGYYTKHYYNGMERIASRLGEQGIGMEQPTDGDLLSRKNDLGKVFTEQFQEMLGNQDSIKLHDTLQLRDLQPNPAGGLYYYHSNHLGSTCYVTDENASVVQGFLHAPFGEITNEYNSSFGSSVLPKYSFNAKELDEETWMYYYEARYMAPPVFISRDPLFEKYPTFSPYAYCANNPVKYIDPDGRDIVITGEDGSDVSYKQNMNSEGYDGFIKHAIETLNYIYSTDEGKNMIDHLCDHGNSVYIQKDDNETHFYAGNVPSTTFFGGIEPNKPGTGIGADINIYWASDNPIGIPVIDGSDIKNPAYDLLDEICHAYDLFTGYGTNDVFVYGGKEYPKSEYQAIYRSNVVRYQLGDHNYRSSYNGKTSEPSTAWKFKKRNEFFRPFWNYPRISGDIYGIMMEG